MGYEKDTIAEGYERLAISKEKQELIYELSKKSEFNHPINLKTIRGKPHYRAGKINNLKISLYVGVSVYTVRRYLNCEHKKARIKGGEYHKHYLQGIKSGRVERRRLKAIQDRKDNPEKWSKMQKR